MAMFGMITQLYTHTGLAPQEPGLQGVGAPQLAVTPAPAPTAAPATSTTPETTFSMSALLGSAGRLLFSPLPATTLFQDSPSVVRSVALPVIPQTLPSRGGGEGSLLQQSTQPAASALNTSDVDTSSAEPVTTSTDPLSGSASREPLPQLHPQSLQIQQAVLTSSSRPPPRVHRPTTTTMTMTRTTSSPCRDSRTSSSPFWCFDAKGGEGVLESGGG